MKLKNKIVSAIMALVMAMSLVATTSLAAAGADGEISATASKVADLQPGEEFTVTVKFEVNPGLQLINLTAKADAGLTLIGAEDCGEEFKGRFYPNYGGGALSTNYSNNYTIFYNDSGSTENNTLADNLCTLTYKVNDNATTGNYNVVIEATEIKNFDKQILDFGSATATVAIKGNDPVTPPAGGDKVEKAVQATVTSYNEKMTGVLFTAVDGSNKGQYVVRFNGAVEAGNVKVGLKVTGVPATNNLTITAENYYGTAATGVLK